MLHSLLLRFCRQLIEPELFHFCIFWDCLLYLRLWLFLGSLRCGLVHRLLFRYTNVLLLLDLLLIPWFNTIRILFDLSRNFDEALYKSMHWYPETIQQLSLKFMSQKTFHYTTWRVRQPVIAYNHQYIFYSYQTIAEKLIIQKNFMIQIAPFDCYVQDFCLHHWRR